MLLALFFWGLAIYGALALVWHVTHRLHKRLQSGIPLTYVVIVHDCQEEIEGWLRQLLSEMQRSQSVGKLVVLDLDSRDDTPLIVQRLQRRNPQLMYVYLCSESELMQQLQQVCMGEPRMGWVYDLRVNGLFRPPNRALR